MNDNVLYELVVEKNHLNLIKQSLSLQINNLYEAVDADVVDTEKAYEDIKMLSDMLAVLRGSTRDIKQTSETTGLIWCKEINLESQVSSLDEEPFEPFNDENLQEKVTGGNSTGQSCLRTRKQMKEYAEKCANRNIQIF